MIDDPKQIRHNPIRVCSWCKRDVAARGFKLCLKCRDMRSATRSRDPVWRAKLVLAFKTRGTLYTVGSGRDLDSE